MVADSDLPSQAFRADFANPSSDTAPIHIETRLDRNTGTYVILWDDIIQVFSNARFVMNGTKAVSFMTDDSHRRLDPLRISHYPEVVLKVVLQDPKDLSAPSPVLSSVSHFCPSTTFIGSSLSDSASADDTSSDNDINHRGYKDAARTTGEAQVLQQLEDLPMHGVKYSQMPVLGDVSRQIQSSSATQYRVLDGGETVPGQLTKVMDISGRTEDQLSTLTKSRELQVQVLEKLQEIQDTQKQFEQSQKEMLDKQQQALDRLVVIQNRVQAVINQTFELHEYPIPRLFIVLPKASRRNDMPSRSLTKQFRLFFLCECGVHTMKEGSKTLHQIHLAKHEGYDVDRPAKFFEKYGSYVLTMMDMIKFGFTTGGATVEPLAMFHGPEAIEILQKSLGVSEHDIEGLVDETIAFIEDQKSTVNGESSLPAKQLELDRANDLEGIDLRQLESYLGVRNQGHVLGNLYRTVTREGHVKWVCQEHYRENHRESTRQHLAEVVEANGGQFIEEVGRIEMTIKSNLAAKQFYEALLKAHGIHELHILLDWDATMDDLKKFAAAITKANIVHLTVNGRALRHPPLDVVNRARRFDPILQLAANGRMQSMKIQQFDKFFFRVGDVPSLETSRLRVLSIEGPRLTKSPSLVTLNKILEQAQSVSEINLEYEDMTGAFDQILTSVSKSQVTLKVNVWWRECYANAWFSQGRPESLEVKLDTKVLDLVHFWEFSQSGLLTKLYLSFDNEEIGFGDVLIRNPNLSDVRILCPPYRFLDLIDHIKSNTSLFKPGPGSVYPSLRKFECQSGNDTTDESEDALPLERLKMTVDISSTSHRDISFDINASSFQDLDQGDRLTKLLREHGGSIKRLDTGALLNDEQVAVLKEAVSKEPEPKLMMLVLHTKPLTIAGLKSMEQVIRRSKEFKRFSVVTRDLHDDAEQNKLARVLRCYNKRLNGLVLSSFLLIRGPQDIPKLTLYRHSLPELDSLVLEHHNNDDCYTCSDCQWIVNLISPPRPETVSGATPSNSMATSIMCKPLKNIRISTVRFTEEAWQMVFEAIDFSGLETLVFDHTSLHLKELEDLAECVLGCAQAIIPLRQLDLSVVYVSSKDRAQALKVKSRIERKAPMVKINMEFSEPSDSQW
ncbi:MAG: hypothetical protein J3Q66DRAFT_107434 [Benniella sp.]|nr:MAG: hypothetical protein J3Q66DRAFT_107434 [Benniella sp.]